MLSPEIYIQRTSLSSEVNTENVRHNDASPKISSGNKPKLYAQEQDYLGQYCPIVSPIWLWPEVAAVVIAIKLSALPKPISNWDCAITWVMILYGVLIEINQCASFALIKARGIAVRSAWRSRHVVWVQDGEIYELPYPVSRSHGTPPETHGLICINWAQNWTMVHLRLVCLLFCCATDRRNSWHADQDNNGVI